MMTTRTCKHDLQNTEYVEIKQRKIKAEASKHQQVIQACNDSNTTLTTILNTVVLRRESKLCASDIYDK